MRSRRRRPSTSRRSRRRATRSSIRARASSIKRYRGPEERGKLLSEISAFCEKSGKMRKSRPDGEIYVNASEQPTLTIDLGKCTQIVSDSFENYKIIQKKFELAQTFMTSFPTRESILQEIFKDLKLCRMSPLQRYMHCSTIAGTRFTLTSMKKVCSSNVFREYETLCEAKDPIYVHNGNKEFRKLTVMDTPTELISAVTAFIKENDLQTIVQAIVSYKQSCQN